MSLRQDRISEQIRDIIGGCFLGGKLEDPRLQGVSITFVKISPDLQVCTVYFRLYSDEFSEAQVVAGLNSAAGFFRKLLAKQLGLRRVPNLRFFFDENIERASRIEELLNQI